MWISCGQIRDPDLSTFDAQAAHGIWRRCQGAFDGAKLLTPSGKNGLSTGYCGPNSNNNKIYI